MRLSRFVLRVFFKQVMKCKSFTEHLPPHLCALVLVTRLEAKVAYVSTILLQDSRMKTRDLFLLLCLVRAASALYKQWIPDTNYENETNWDKGAVPCGNDVIQFPPQRRVSVFVESMHAVKEMRMPVHGEFILTPGSGFYVLDGQEPGCGQGVVSQFKDSEHLRWFDPVLWHTAATRDDLEHGNFIFSVHEESVPCRYDDVVFKEWSSFRVDTSSSQSSSPVKSVSVLGKKFDSESEFTRYLSSQSGQLQFHGSSPVAVGNPGCADPSGCDCGNAANHRQICSTITCPSLSCGKPLLPVGHCCEVCGAIVSVHYDDGFNLQAYRQRIHNLFLTQPTYKSTQLGMSKVLKSQRLMGIIPFSAAEEIQVLILDGEEGARSAALAQDILKDVRTYGSSIGISGAEVQTSSGSQSGGSAGMVVGVVFGVLIIIALVCVTAVLIRKGVLKAPSMPSMPTLSSLKRQSGIGELGGPLDHGFDNPMFDKPGLMPDIPSLYGAGSNHSISMTQTGVYFVNPVFDDKETDFNA
ncbi:protein amnionless [Betta splendens]|uniref:Protein amnionless n=1 Tax=Betta splendens TaxID=158456 RepID=A0A6P7N6G6_BETSP|nr:protein amnionless [Betta splendens]